VDRALQVDQDSRGPVTQAAWLIPCAIALLLVGRHLLASGTWLDEYWQSWVSGAPASALASRLATDAHPPWFNLFARLILAVTGGAIIPARLLDLAAATTVLAIGLSQMRGLEAALRWRIGLMILASGGALGMTGLAASFRSYPWLLVLAGLQAAMLACVASRRPLLPILAIAVTAGSIMLHYVHAAGAIAIALATVAVAWRTERRSAYFVLAGLVVGSVLDLITGLIQLPHWRVIFDVNWIAESGGGGLFPTLLAAGADFVTGSVIAAALLAAGLIVRRSRTVWLLLSPIPLAMIGWLILDAWTPVLVPRYLASITALLATGAAVAWWELSTAALANGVIALLVAAQPVASSLIRPPLPGWEAGARVAAQAARTCEGAPIYTVSPWRFRDHPDSQTARFEQPVIALAYEKVGREFGLSPRFVASSTTLDLNGCSAIVWIEAAHGIEQVPAAVILRRAQLSLSQSARVRIEPTPNGAVLLISSADRLQPRL